MEDDNESCLLDNPCLLCYHSPSHRSLDAAQKVTTEDRKTRTYREVSVKVVFPVKKRLPIYGAVESQSCHHRCFDAALVQDLGTHGDIMGTDDLRMTGYVYSNHIRHNLQVMCRVRTHRRMTPGNSEEPRSEPERQRTAWYWS